MRKIRVGGLAVALLTGWGLAGSATGTEPDPSATPPTAKTASGSSWWNWFGPSQKADKKSPAKGDKRSPDQATAKPAGKKDEDAELRERERAALLRRLDVIDQLRSVAAQKNDDTLWQQANELDARVLEIYNQRTAHLTVGKLEAEPIRSMDGGPGVDVDLGDSPIRIPASVSPPGNRGGRGPAGEVNR